MLPASTLTAISNVLALNLEPHTTMKVLGAILAPVLSSDSTPARKAGRPGPKPRKAPRRKKPKRQAAAHGAKSATVADLTADGRDAPRQRAIAALKANPGVSLTKVAKIAKCSRSTVVNARDELGAEARKQARKQAGKSLKPETIEARQRAQRFLKDALARGPKPAGDVEEAAEKAHVDPDALTAVRTELGIVTSRGNAGGVMAVQWGLP